MYRIRIKWEHDEDTSYIGEDCCHSFEPNTSTDRDYSNQLDIPGTYAKLLSVGGCTPEQAHRQTSWAWNRLRQWHNDQWNYVGCIAYVDQLVDEDDDTWEEVGDASVWDINNDCGDYRLETETTQIHEVLRQLQSAGTITSFSHSVGKCACGPVGSRPNDLIPRGGSDWQCPRCFSWFTNVNEWRIDGVTVEVIEDEESVYMTDEPSDDYELLPAWNEHLELRAYGDTRLQYHCTSCGEDFDADTFTESEVKAGHCKETTCCRYPHKYVVLYRPTDQIHACVLAHPTGRVQEEWDRVLTRLDNRVRDNSVPPNVPLLTWYAYHTGCDILAEVPDVTTTYAWSKNTYIDKAPSFAWVTGEGELLA